LEKTFIICNPAAGEGLARKRWKKLRHQLEEIGLPFEYRLTEHPNHASEIASEIVENGYNRIAVFGGDGTVNEVLQGIMSDDKVKLKDLQLILLPAGSSCDFEKKFSQKKTFIEKIQSRETWQIDIFKVECQDDHGFPVSRFIFNNSSIGVISLANEKFCSVKGLSKFIKQISVDVAAITAGIDALVKFEDFACNLKIDDSEYNDKQLSNMTIFKTPYFGGGMYYGVETEQDNGVLNLALIDSVSRLKLLTMIPALYTGKIFKRKPVHYKQCRSFELVTEQPLIVETDGENIGYPPAKYTILEKAINVLI